MSKFRYYVKYMEPSQKPQNTLFFFKRSDLKDSRLVRVAIGLFLLALFTSLFPYAESIEGAYRVGMLWQESNLVATFSFPILREAKEVERDRAEASAAVRPVVVQNPKIENLAGESIAAEIPLLMKASDLRAKWMRTRSTADSAACRVATELLHFQPDSTAWLVAERMRSGAGSPMAVHAFEEKLSAILPELFAPGILDSGDLKRAHDEFVIRDGRLEETVPASRFITLSEAKTRAQELLAKAFGDRNVAALGTSILSQFIVPNVFYDAGETGREIKSAIDNVPTTSGFVREGEVIVRKDERISEDASRKIESYRKAKSTEGTDVDRKSQIAGIALHTGLLLAIFGVYLFLFRKRIFYHNGSSGRSC